MEIYDYRIIDYLEGLENVNDKLMVMALYYDVANIMKPILTKIYPNYDVSNQDNAISGLFKVFLVTDPAPRKKTNIESIDLIYNFIWRMYGKLYPNNMSVKRGNKLINEIKVIDEEYLKSKAEERSSLVNYIDSKDISFSEKVSLYLDVINNKQTIDIEPLTKKLSVNI